MAIEAEDFLSDAAGPSPIINLIKNIYQIDYYTYFTCNLYAYTHKYIYVTSFLLLSKKKVEIDLTKKSSSIVPYTHIHINI